MSTPLNQVFTLITAAKNEEGHIGQCIDSVINQSYQPIRWVIVSDGSTDKTDIIVTDYATSFSFIQLVRREPGKSDIGFASKVLALQRGLHELKNTEFAFLGHLDADITLSQDYFKRILQEFQLNDRLGIAGGFIHELKRGVFRNRPGNVSWSVAGGIQMFRRQCYRDIGDFKPLRLGGEDWYAEIRARINGWEVRSFPGIVAYHHQQSTRRRGIIHEALREGKLSYFMGTHPLFELFKCVKRIIREPYGIFALLRAYGFFHSYINSNPKGVTEKEIDFIRREELAKVQTFIHYRAFAKPLEKFIGRFYSH